ncbi:Uncharacterized protein CHISP_2963 [Chitinispirillum alkaliphilum]|nr:Uncharacterized protein CHISP_2963 [Chitinispirillum alkaliphilum]
MSEQSFSITQEMAVCRGMIKSLNQDGSITVDTMQGESLNCYLVRNCKTELIEFEPDQQVLFIKDSREEIGYILGVVDLYLPVKKMQPSEHTQTPKTEDQNKPAVAKVDGKKVLIEAQNEIRLQCGKGSITITEEGKVSIRGNHLVSRSSGINNVKGATVAIN